MCQGNGRAGCHRAEPSRYHHAQPTPPSNWEESCPKTSCRQGLKADICPSNSTGNPPWRQDSEGLMQPTGFIQEDPLLLKLPGIRTKSESSLGSNTTGHLIHIFAFIVAQRCMLAVSWKSTVDVGQWGQSLWKTKCLNSNDKLQKYNSPLCFVPFLKHYSYKYNSILPSLNSTKVKNCPSCARLGSCQWGITFSHHPLLPDSCPGSISVPGPYSSFVMTPHPSLFNISSMELLGA